VTEASTCFFPAPEKTTELFSDADQSKAGRDSRDKTSTTHTHERELQ
jgi:hypothetical protein